jgi:hypothetical protein
MRFATPVQVFCSYAHEDRKFLQKFRKQSKPLELHKPPYVQQWSDREICAGMDWAAAIHESAHKAELFVLLVSDDFLSSGYCMGTELSLAREKYDQEEAAIVSVVVRDCFWEVIPELTQFQVLPEDGEPAGRKDKAWKQVIAGLKASIDKLCKGTFFPAKSDPQGAEVPDLLPHLCGRSLQEARFSAALGAAPRQRPFVCIVSGGENQGHSQFIDRLVRKAGEVLGVGDEHAVYDPEPELAWTRIEEAPDISAELSAILNNPRPASPTAPEIARAVAAHPGLTVIRSTWVSRDWRGNTGWLLTAFVKLWESWPDLEANQHVIVFLAVKYLDPQDQAANASMAAGIAELATGGSLLKLALGSVTRKEIIDWLDSDPLIGGNYNKERMVKRVQEIIQEDEEMPMEELAPELMKLLAQFRT